MKLEEGIVEIKKDFFCEKDVRSKVSSTNVTFSHSKKIEKMLTEFKFYGLIGVSLKHASTEETLS